jgi:hypothetical protein
MYTGLHLQIKWYCIGFLGTEGTFYSGLPVRRMWSGLLRQLWQQSLSDGKSCSCLGLSMSVCHPSGPVRGLCARLQRCNAPSRRPSYHELMTNSERECHQKETATPRSKYLFRFIHVPLPEHSCTTNLSVPRQRKLLDW